MKNDARGVTPSRAKPPIPDRRSGPADRRSQPRGGRRRGDMLTASVVLTGALLGSCSKLLSPVGPGEVGITQESVLFSTSVTDAALVPVMPPAQDSNQTSQTSPGSKAGTVLSPGDDLQAAVDAAPAGTMFIIRQGVHRRQTIKPKDGMSFVGEAGTVLDGEGVTPRAFRGQTVRGVTIRGLRITGYAPPANSAALDGIDSINWTVEDNEIDHNGAGTTRAFGLRLGDDMVVRGNRIHHNAWVGVAGYQADRAVIERNEIYANPPAVVNDSIGEASNLKLVACGNVVVRDNYVHDGPMIGIWLDTMKPDNSVEGNRVINHGGTGIWYEVSYRATLSRNYVENAGYRDTYTAGWLRGAGIQVTNSPDVSVLNNTVTNSLNGIVGQQATGYANGPYGASELRNLVVRGNTIVMPKGQTGIVRNVAGDGVYESWNNRFEGNRYEIRGNSKPFYWKGRAMTESEWKAGPGASDTFVR
jgi:nitrous oxidase accessory protein NosD